MRQDLENNFMSSIKTIRRQNKPEKDNNSFLTLKIYKNAAFLDTISRFYTHLELDIN